MKKIVIETFNDPTGYWLNQINKEEPSCFNGIVRYKKYRVTVEEIEEPKEVYIERLEKMIKENTNWHHSLPLDNALKKVIDG